MEKRVLRPDRLRTLPAQWSWVDQRLVRMKSSEIRNMGAWAMYLFLVTVSDKDGLSYYSDKAIGNWLGMSVGEVAFARAELIHADLLTHQGAIYQLLSMPCEKEVNKTQPATQSDMMSVRTILQTIAGGAK